MKRPILIFSLLSVFFSAVVFAESQNIDPNMDTPREEEARAERSGGRVSSDEMGKMGGKKMGMIHQQPTMLATADGGVLVLAGNKLAKYDSTLTLINEVELRGGPSSSKEKRRQVSSASRLAEDSPDVLEPTTTEIVQ